MIFRATWPILPDGLDMTRAELSDEVANELADLQFKAGAELTGPVQWRVDSEAMLLIAEAPARPWVDELARRRVPHDEVTECAACHHAVYRRGTPHADRPPGARQHQARRLCSTCYVPGRKAVAA